MNTPASSEGNRPRSYHPGNQDSRIRLDLSRNEGKAALPRGEDFAFSDMSAYPDLGKIQHAMANFYQVDLERIVPTAGGDQAIETVYRWISFQNNSEAKVLTHSPSFEMLEVYATNVGMEHQQVEWLDGPFPIEAFCSRARSSDLAVVVSPNNPTGGVVDAAALERLARLAREQNFWLLLDFAYLEFATRQVAPLLLDQPRVLMVRTLSKAWGLAGLRVGCVIAPNAEVAGELEAIRGPFPLSCRSIETGCRALETGREIMGKQVECVREGRQLIRHLLQKQNIPTLDSEANFVTANFGDGADWVEKFAQHGIRVRGFRQPPMNQFLRITVPCSQSEFDQLWQCLHQLFDKTPPTERSFLMSSQPPPQDLREAKVTRETRETKIELQIQLDGDGQSEIDSGFGFFDHMLEALTCHSGINLKLTCQGDSHVDDHHSLEDCAISLGKAITESLDAKRGIQRFASAYAPLDEALVRCVIDLSGRPHAEVHLGFEREMLGTVACENLTHFFRSLAINMNASLHLDLIRGENDHHKAEAAFKALALAFRQAIQIRDHRIPSTKGSF